MSDQIESEALRQWRQIRQLGADADVADDYLLGVLTQLFSESYLFSDLGEEPLLRSLVQRAGFPKSRAWYEQNLYTIPMTFTRFRASRGDIVFLTFMIEIISSAMLLDNGPQLIKSDLHPSQVVQLAMSTQEPHQHTITMLLTLLQKIGYRLTCDVRGETVLSIALRKGWDHVAQFYTDNILTDQVLSDMSTGLVERKIIEAATSNIAYTAVAVRQLPWQLQDKIREAHEIIEYGSSQFVPVVYGRSSPEFAPRFFDEHSRSYWREKSRYDYHDSNGDDPAFP